MRNITNGTAINGYCVGGTSPSYGLSTITLPLETPLRHNPFNNNVYGTANQSAASNYNGDLASVDSSDTYASCQTHPFLSQADLDQDMEMDGSRTLDEIDMNNLYINPLEKGATNLIRSQVKKSASGDTALRSLGGDASPMDEGFQQYQTFEQRERGSRGSLNETPVPKHRKTRFQQLGVSSSSSATQAPLVTTSVATVVGTKPKARFDIGSSTKQSQESLNEVKKKSRSSFMPAKSLASATKLINQHLFGIQSIGSKSLCLSKK